MAVTGAVWLMNHFQFQCHQGLWRRKPELHQSGSGITQRGRFSFGDLIRAMQSAVDAPVSCPFMTELVGLLSEPSFGRHKRGEGTAERLSELEADARRHGAREATLVAIKGARILVRLGELPPAPMRNR